MSGVHPARAQKTHVVGGSLPIANSPNAPIIEPWDSGRILENTPSLAQTLKSGGYTTGHTGKWHIAVNHHETPQPMDIGFDFTTHFKGQDTRGVQNGMKNRLAEFSTTDADSKYPLDENGFPTDPITEESLRFMEDNKNKPFFLYNATWLVHTPIQSRSKSLLEKYCKKLGVDFPTDPNGTYPEGQLNPYYCAMVETLDYYTGKLINYLDATDDPRWPGHKLSENTYIIFTSDNGGMEGNSKKGMITDNYPLDRGKLSAKEGGTRVPFFIAGPKIKGGIESDVMINALDLYPTILSWTGIKPADQQLLDGADLSSFLQNGSQTPADILDKKGNPRNSLIWHYPHPSHSCSTIRKDGYKLLINYGAEYKPTLAECELYQLYDDKGERVDIEEKNNIANEKVDIANSLKDELNNRLDAMSATRPYRNHNCKSTGEKRTQIPSELSHTVEGSKVSLSFNENGAKVTKAYLYYTTPDEKHSGEWFRSTATINDGTVSANIPTATSQFFLSLVDENNFLVLYPNVPSKKERGKKPLSDYALSEK